MRADRVRPRRKRRPINVPPPQSVVPVSARHLAPIGLAAGSGLLICSIAETLSRTATSRPQLLFWIGVLLIALPIFYRLTSREASASERFVLVCLLGLALYGVKLVRDAPLFAFSDELIHAFNAEQNSQHHELFLGNSILPVTPYFPGLEGATTALTQLTGMSAYGAGIVVVGAARLLLVAALFLLFGRISGSARTAGLGVAIYTGSYNFLFWGAQYSYQSLALPLMVLVLLVLAEREGASRSWARSWTFPIVAGTAAVVVTHHLTSYALAILVAALAVAYRGLRGTWRWANPWGFAVVAAVLAVGWLVFVATSTIGYLSPVLSDAFSSILNTVSGEEAPRALLQGKGSVPETPLIARAVTFLAVGLLVAGMPFGLARIWRRHRNKPFALVFALIGVAFFATLALRLVPAAWETGNRSGDFLFIGLAFVLACAGFQNWRPRGSRRLGRGLLTGLLGIVLVGGAIAGWSWDLNLASPLRASAQGNTIVSPSLGMAEWAVRATPETGRFAAATADARLLLFPGGRRALSEQGPDIEDIIAEPQLAGWELPVLRRHHIRYVVADRRRIASDGLRGYFFSTGGPGSGLLSRTAITKFDAFPGAARVYTNGNIAVYDLGRR